MSKNDTILHKFESSEEKQRKIMTGMKPKMILFCVQQYFWFFFARLSRMDRHQGHRLAGKRSQTTGRNSGKTFHPGHILGRRSVHHARSTVLLFRKQGRPLHVDGRGEGVEPDGGEEEGQFHRLQMLLRLLR
jgi:hypothetical protein